MSKVHKDFEKSGSKVSYIFLNKFEELRKQASENFSTDVGKECVIFNGNVDSEFMSC